jgi:hypothetical protein
MKKDEVIDLYLLARMMHSSAAHNRRMHIKNEYFEWAMQSEFEMHFWRDESNEIEDELLKQSWFGAAWKELFLC